MAKDVDANDADSETDDGMSYFEALKMFMLGIALPTWDILTDIRFIIQLLIPACYSIRGPLIFRTFDIFKKYFNDYNQRKKTFSHELNDT